MQISVTYGLTHWNNSHLISVLFGYSPDDAERFIDASDANKSPPTAELDEQSRNQLQRLRTDYEKLNQDFIC